MTGSPGRRSGTRPWALASSVIAPIALIGGWTLAAHLQPPGYDPIRQTISALAAHGAHDRYMMTTGLFVLGLCHLITAAGLRPAGRAARACLAVGGAANIAVAAFPQPQGGSSPAHVAAATVGFLALTAWPALATPQARTLLARRAALPATAVLLALLVWFGVTLGGDHAGLSERVLAGAQALWPLAVVVSTLRRGTIAG